MESDLIMPKITKKNLFVDGICRFCHVKKGNLHYQCYHGFGDFVGTYDLGIKFRKT